MKERPILFQGAMVRALLDGSKTQTRRIMSRQPNANGLVALIERPICKMKDKPVLRAWFHEDGVNTSTELTCPYGKPGDQLWVRETFVHIDDEGDKFDGMGSQTYYRASCMDEAKDTAWLRERGLTWTPSIHMSRKYSRIQLEIVSVRVERLSDCSEADALAEGVAIEDRHSGGYCAGEFLPPAIRAYRELWESINGAGSWDANPWVWVIEFKRIKP